MSGRDYYTVLGVSEGASPEEIKRAHRKLAKQHHPDRNRGDQAAEAKFKEVQEAYDVLGDKQKRQEYDQFGRAGVGCWQQAPQGQKVYSWGGGSQVNIDDLEDLFTAFGGGGQQGGASVFGNVFDRMGGQRRRPGPQRGADIEQNLPLSFEQAVQGTTVELGLHRPGGGAPETLSVKIPAGVESGRRIRLRGRGEPGGNGGAPGDLFLLCSVQPHRFFERRGDDVYLEVPVTVAEAALGAKVDVPTLDGTMTMTIPPGTGGGAKLRLRDKGVSRGDSSRRGDQIAVIRIVMPAELSPEQKQLFESLAEMTEGNPREEWQV
ncbi:MAG: DnaJ domain-containing protein [bacterium]|nr:DnaJ domain-containing protein [bacterium]